MLDGGFWDESMGGDLVAGDAEGGEWEACHCLKMRAW